MENEVQIAAASPGEDEPVSRRALLNAGLAVAAAGAGGLATAAPARGEAEAAVGFGAPLAEIEVPAGLLSAEQKSAMIEGVTDVLASALRLPPPRHPALWVLILETAPEGWGIAGRPFVPRSALPPAATQK